MNSVIPAPRKSNATLWQRLEEREYMLELLSSEAARYLSPREREAAVAVFVERRSLVRAAADVGENVYRLKYHLARARRVLRNWLAAGRPA